MDKKRVLITAASNVDPYTISNGEYNDGSIMAILRKKIKDNEPITDIYIYLSLEMAIIEFKEENNIISKAIKHLYEQNNLKINIEFFPTEIKEEVTGLLSKTTKKVIEDAIKEEEEKGKVVNENRIISKLLSNKVQIAATNVNKFGLFYPTYYEMFEKAIKEDKDVELFVNISSGTSAMQEDIALISLTNKEKTPTILQVSTPAKSSNNRGTQIQVTSSKNELEELNRTENAKDSERVSVEEMKKTKKLMLLQSLEYSFEKHDFAGVYDAILENDEIIDNKDILKYASNLYHRYIGDDEIAINSIDFVRNNNLYPIFDDSAPINDFLKMRDLIERINIMQVKAERNEINDWLLITQTVIESLYIKLIYYICDNFDINNIIINETDTDILNYASNIGKISLEKFNRINVNRKYDCLYNVIRKSDLSYINAFVSKNILYEWWKNSRNDKYLKENINILDKIRNFRNTAAHTDTFITIGQLKKGFKDAINLENEFRSNKGYNLIKINNNEISDVIGTTNKLIKQIVLKILENNDSQKYNEKILNQSLNIYETIKNKIIELLKNEIEDKSGEM